VLAVRRSGDWLVRSSSDGSVGSFGTIDLDASLEIANAILVTVSGAIFVGGSDNSSPEMATVKKAHLSATAVWDTVDSYVGVASGTLNECVNLVENTETGDVFSAMRTSDGETNTNYRSVTIRKSADRGSNWHTFYRLNPVRESPDVFQVQADMDMVASGNLFLVGFGAGGAVATNPELVVRRIEKSDQIVFTASVDNTATGQFRFEAEFPTEIRDSNNNHVFRDSAFATSVFGISSSQFQEKPLPADIFFKVSASDVVFTGSELYVGFKDGVNHPSYKSLTEVGTFFPLSDGVFEYRGRLLLNPSFALDNTEPSIRISSSIGVHRLFDFEMEFHQPLTDEGVRIFKEIDNQNLEFEYVNFGLLKGIE